MIKCVILWLKIITLPAKISLWLWNKSLVLSNTLEVLFIKITLGNDYIAFSEYTISFGTVKGFSLLSHECISSLGILLTLQQINICIFTQEQTVMHITQMLKIGTLFWKRKYMKSKCICTMHAAQSCSAKYCQYSAFEIQLNI